MLIVRQLNSAILLFPVRWMCEMCSRSCQAYCICTTINEEPMPPDTQSRVTMWGAVAATTPARANANSKPTTFYIDARALPPTSPPPPKPSHSAQGIHTAHTHNVVDLHHPKTARGHLRARGSRARPNQPPLRNSQAPQWRLPGTYQHHSPTRRTPMANPPSSSTPIPTSAASLATPAAATT